MNKENKNHNRRPVVRIDRFILTYNVCAEFTEKLREILVLLRKQPGFISDLLLEQPVSMDTVHIVTIVAFLSTDDAENANHEAKKEFDLGNIIDRLKIIADIGLFSVIEK